MTSNILSSNEHRERRLSPRVTPNPLLIIRLPSGNQGIVLDISHDGLGFLLSTPVEEAQAVRFEISRRSTRGFEATGQLMWKDSTSTRGGLRFTHLPEGLRAIIPTSVPPEQPRPAPAVEPKALGNEVLILQEVEETVRPASRTNSGVRKFAANSFTLALSCLIVLAVWYSIDRRDALNSLSNLKRHVSAPFSLNIDRVPSLWAHLTKSTPTQPARLAVANVPIPQSNALDIPLKAALPDDEKTVTTEILGTPKTPILPAAAPPETDLAIEALADHAAVPVLDDHGQTQLTLARRLLEDDSNPANQPKAAQLLWQAIERGSVAAEVALAGLYLVGGAVPKNCSQALILLTAARNHENALAEQKLGDLHQYGCDSSENAVLPSSEDLDTAQ